MTAVGIRELKQHTSEILRRVRERGETIDINYHGATIARIVPVNPPRPSAEELTAYWAAVDRLAAEVSARWPEGVSAADAVNDVRRDL
jgi:prevent-host-death family protein